ncbi:MAG: NTP transferase domain-containing protein [Caulobacteraceae bacterium]
MPTGGRLEATILAGGAGARFGGAKLLSPWRGGRLIDGALGAAFAAPARTVSVVTGADPAVAGAARAWARSRGEEDRLRLVHAHDHAEGMGASLRAAIASLPVDAAGAFVFLGDMPAIPRAVLPALAAAVEAGAVAAAPVFDGRRGHPVLFARSLFERLARATGDEGARRVLADLDQALALVETDDPGVLFDVDRGEPHHR